MLYAFTLVLLVLDVFFWRAANRRLRRLRHARPWLWGLAAFMAVVIAYDVLMLAWPQLLRRSGGPVPMVVHAGAYLWHLAFLPITLLLLVLMSSPAMLSEFVEFCKRLWAERSSHGQPGFPVISLQDAGKGKQKSSDEAAANTGGLLKPAPTRRQMLAAAAMTLPPLATCAAAVAGVRSFHGWQVQPFKLSIPNLPPALDGMTIAHVSDTHIGKFLHPSRLPAIADDINKLDADFIAFTGDLIDLSLDDLPHGIDFLHSLKSRCGMVICEGNHDLMQGRGRFQDGLQRAGLSLIVGNQMTLTQNARDGRSFPVQFLAVPWNPGESEMQDAVDILRPTISPDAFPILLAHHPHSFDAAAAAGFPLILSGHTHGGQIMWDSQIGLGKLRFRYTSGLYKKTIPTDCDTRVFHTSNLIVNNGLGNWFPLRVNAPAQLVHITLHRA